MNEKEVISRLNGLLVTDFFYGGHTKTGVYWQKEVCFKEDHKFYAEAIETVLQLLEQKDKRIDELEKALVEEAIKSTEKIKQLNSGINKLMAKRKKWKNRYYKNKTKVYKLKKKIKEDIGIGQKELETEEWYTKKYAVFDNCIEYAKEILKILEE